MRGFEYRAELIHRLIHRSWGETFLNIFLDLSKYISHFSSSTVVCALRGITKGPLLEGCGFDRGTMLATRSGWKWMTALSVRTVRRLSTVRGRQGD
jgi:hypothetical protein